MATRDVIWILGASTAKTFEAITNNVTPNTEIVICASLETYQKAMESKQVYDLPTNLRTHHGPVPKIMGSIDVHDTDSFKEAQKDASLALAKTLNLARDNGIPVYFAIVERNKRPTYLVQDVQTRSIRASNKKRFENILNRKYSKNLYFWLVPCITFSNINPKKLTQSSTNKQCNYTSATVQLFLLLVVSFSFCKNRDREF